MFRRYACVHLWIATFGIFRQNKMKYSNFPFHAVNLFEIDGTVIEKSRPERDRDVISLENLKTIEGYVAVNFEVASSNTV